MVQTRSQLKKLSKEELINELMRVDDISTKLSELSNRFDNILRRFEVFSSDQLERNAFTNAQHLRRESVKVNPVSASISDEELELTFTALF